MHKTPKINCPYCGKEGTWTTENKFRPFCSERCKLIDLGNWADEKHRIPSQENVDTGEILEKDHNESEDGKL